MSEADVNFILEVGGDLPCEHWKNAIYSTVVDAWSRNIPPDSILVVELNARIEEGLDLQCVECRSLLGFLCPKGRLALPTYSVEGMAYVQRSELVQALRRFTQSLKVG